MYVILYGLYVILYGLNVLPYGLNVLVCKWTPGSGLGPHLGMSPDPVPSLVKGNSVTPTWSRPHPDLDLDPQTLDLDP